MDERPVDDRFEDTPEEGGEPTQHKLAELEQRFRDPYVHDEIARKLRHGPYLLPEELRERAKQDISELSWQYPEPVSSPEFWAKNPIDPNGMIFVHATKYPPTWRHGELIVVPTGGADPYRRDLGRRSDGYREAAGARSMRLTVHWGIMGSQASHEERKEDGTVDQDALRQRPIFILAPVGEALNEASNAPLNLNSSDTFFLGPVHVPAQSILILTPAALERARLPEQAFATYQILVTPDPGKAYQDLLTRKPFERFAEIGGRGGYNYGFRKQVSTPHTGPFDFNKHGLEAHFEHLVKNLDEATEIHKRILHPSAVRHPEGYVLADAEAYRTIKTAESVFPILGRVLRATTRMLTEQLALSPQYNTELHERLQQVFQTALQEILSVATSLTETLSRISVHDVLFPDPTYQPPFDPLGNLVNPRHEIIQLVQGVELEVTTVLQDSHLGSYLPVILKIQANLRSFLKCNWSLPV